MKAGKSILLALLALAALYGFGRLFVESLGGGGRGSEAAGVQLAPPPGFRVAEGGELSRLDAARRLKAAVESAPAESRLGLHFTSGDFELTWLVDRSDSSAPRLTELSAGPATRVESVYAGELAARLAWAAEHGRFDAPGTSPPESHNLYH